MARASSEAWPSSLAFARERSLSRPEHNDDERGHRDQEAYETVALQPVRKRLRHGLQIDAAQRRPSLCHWLDDGEATLREAGPSRLRPLRHALLLRPGIGGKEGAVGTIEGGDEHLRIGAQRIDVFLRGAPVVERERGRDRRGQNPRLHPGLPHLLGGVGLLVAVGEEAAAEQKRERHGRRHDEGQLPRPSGPDRPDHRAASPSPEH